MVMGSYRDPSFYSTGSYPLGLGVHDLNHDGRLDIVVSNFWDNNLSVFLGYSDYAFLVIDTFSMGNGLQPTSFAVADFNNDSQIDLAISHMGNSTMSVFLGNGELFFHWSQHLSNQCFIIYVFHSHW